MFKFVLALAAVATSVSAAAICNAVPLSGLVYLSEDFTVYHTIDNPKIGQQVTATVVNLATCAPYTSGRVKIDVFRGSVMDVNFDYTDMSMTKGVNTTGNSLSFEISTPAHSTQVTSDVSLQMSPGGIDNYNWALKNVGVVLTIV
ncbi:hypothetical protein EXIGLDRAFT_487514 [Exidia glandulosa HHB12029]|uniref:Uncharacterized protein n=1 Tax=Exidia glandulosa HHB12029 TaxID=1314781 RepID=A0A165JNH2_EXIGL|nr:hypothetical protein EXIGLDRAFT_487514 [Exidia glandulosa HHB12029]